jgi:hypothetical protein
VVIYVSQLRLCLRWVGEGLICPPLYISQGSFGTFLRGFLVGRPCSVSKPGRLLLYVVSTVFLCTDWSQFQCVSRFRVGLIAKSFRRSLLWLGFHILLLIPLYHESSLSLCLLLVLALVSSCSTVSPFFSRLSGVASQLRRCSTVPSPVLWRLRQVCRRVALLPALLPI